MPSSRDAAVKTRLTTGTLGLALQIYQVGIASLGLLFGVCTVRAHQARPDGADACFGGAELRAIAE